MGPATTLSAAVAAAQDGDAILVAAGTYDQPTVIDDKSILIQAEANATVDLGAAPFRLSMDWPTVPEYP